MCTHKKYVSVLLVAVAVLGANSDRPHDGVRNRKEETQGATAKLSSADVHHHVHAEQAASSKVISAGGKVPAEADALRRASDLLASVATHAASFTQEEQEAKTQVGSASRSSEQEALKRQLSAEASRSGCPPEIQKEIAVDPGILKRLEFTGPEGVDDNCETGQIQKIGEAGNCFIAICDSGTKTLSVTAGSCQISGDVMTLGGGKLTKPDYIKGAGVFMHIKKQLGC